MFFCVENNMDRFDVERLYVMKKYLSIKGVLTTTNIPEKAYWGADQFILLSITQQGAKTNSTEFNL